MSGLSQPMRPVPPLRLKDYELLAELATGGMGILYVANRSGAAGFGRLVVVKKIHRHLLYDSVALKLLRDEANITSTIHHTNVVPTIDVVEVDNEVALVFDYVEGVSLAELLNKTGALPHQIASRIVSDVLLGLQAAHTAKDTAGRPLGIVHRDISPQNVLVGRDGITRIIDFGIAKATAYLAETTSLSVRGKLRYMSPEQLGQRRVDLRSDLFSTGSMLFEAMFGSSPHIPQAGDATPNEGQMALLVLMSEKPTFPAHTSPSLQATLLRAIERSPADRFPSAFAFYRALNEAVPPASHDAVQALVEREFASVLDARAEVLREQLSRKSNATGEAQAVRASAAPPVGRHEIESQSHRRSRMVFALLAVAALSGLLWNVIRYVPRTPPTPNPSADRVSPTNGREAWLPPPNTAVSDLATIQSASAERPPGLDDTPNGPVRSKTPAGSLTQKARNVGTPIHENPYR